MIRKLTIITMLCLLLCGCTETQKWGKNPTAGYVKNFGDSNLARLCYALVQQGNRHTTVLNVAAKRILIIESDPNDLVARVEELEAKALPSNGISLGKDGSITQNPIIPICDAKPKESESKRLVTLEERNSEALVWYSSANDPFPNGIACPECGAELYDTQPNMMLTSNPPQYYIGCQKCDYTGTRF